MTDKDPLDPFFEAAQDARPVPPGALMARVMTGAEEEIARRARVPEPVQAGLPVRLKEALGGWPGLAGLAATAAAGLLIGIALPELGSLALPMAGAEAGFDLTDLLPGYGAGAFEEG